MSYVQGEPVPANGTATTTPAYVAVVNKRGKTSYARQGTFEGLDGTNDLLVSVDNGNTFVTLKHGDPPLVINGAFTGFFVKASASTVVWTAMLTVA